MENIPLLLRLEFRLIWKEKDPAPGQRQEVQEPDLMCLGWTYQNEHDILAATEFMGYPEKEGKAPRNIIN